MSVDMVFKIAAIGIIVAVLNQVLIRAGREEQAMMTALAGLIVVLLDDDSGNCMGCLTPSRPPLGYSDEHAHRLQAWP